MKLENDLKFLMAKYEYEKENYETVLSICDDLIENDYAKGYGLKGLILFYFNKDEAKRIFEKGIKKGDLISKFFKLLLDNPSLKEPSNILRKTNDIPLNDVIGVLITHLDYEVDEFFASILYSYSLKDVKEILQEYEKAMENQNDRRISNIKEFLNLVNQIDTSHIKTVRDFYAKKS